MEILLRSYGFYPNVRLTDCPGPHGGKAIIVFMPLRSSLIFLLLDLALWGQSAKITVDLIDIAPMEQRLRAFPLKNEERQGRARLLFEDLKCPKIVEVPLGKKEVPANVVCIYPGESQKTIWVGAHFDKVSAGEGKIDNATGVVLLSALAKSLASVPRRHTFVFSAFADEEKGLLGSAALVKKGIEGVKGKELMAGISAMVNIDSVGAGATAVALSASDKEFAGIAFKLAEKLQVGLRSVNLDRVGQSDGASFRKHGVRVIEFHSLDNSNWQILHSAKDTMEAFRGKEYHETYQLLAFFLAQLDLFLNL